MKPPEISPEQVIWNNHFLNHIIMLLKVKNDAALARILELAPPVISKIRHGGKAVGPAMMIHVHELTGMPFTEIRNYVPKIPSSFQPPPLTRFQKQRAAQNQT
ncbi:hypothetical protein AAKU55_003897 [Oxalobacteraceae bacterium GrIS 1.11]